MALGAVDGVALGVVLGVELGVALGVELGEADRFNNSSAGGEPTQNGVCLTQARFAVCPKAKPAHRPSQYREWSGKNSLGFTAGSLLHFLIHTLPLATCLISRLNNRLQFWQYKGRDGALLGVITGITG